MKTFLVRNFPIASEFRPQTTGSVVRNKLCYVGGISEIRGAKQMFQAASLAKTELIVAGEFATEEDRRLLMPYVDDRYVKLLGQIGRSQLNEVFEQCVAGVVLFLPEKNHINSQPNKLFEYMSAGIAILCSDFPAWREVIERSACGVLVDPTDVSAIADAMRRLVDSPATTAELGLRGLSAVSTLYSWGNEENALKLCYDRIEAALRK